MPRIPRADFGDTQSTRTPMPQVNPNAPLEAFGGGQSLLGTTQAAQNLVKGGQELVLEQKKQADDAASMKIYDQLLQHKNDLLYNPKTGAMNRKGEQAFGAAEEYQGAFDKYATALEQSLSNDEQRVMFQRMKSRVGGDLNDTLQRHTYSEAEKYKIEVANNTMKSVTDDAVLNWFQPGKVDESLEMVRGIAREQAKAQGLSELAPQKEREAASKIYSGVIDRMMATGDDLQAKKYFEKIKEEMTGADAVAVEKSLKVASTRGEAQRVTDQIITTAGTNLGSALEEARKLPYGEVRDQVNQRIKEHFADKRMAEEEADRQNFDAASDIIENSGGRGTIPPQMLAGMPSAKREALEKRAAQLRAGIDPEPNSQAYYDLMRIAASNPQKFRSLNLREYIGKITQSEMTQMIKDQTSRDGAGSKELDGYRTNSQIVDTTIKAMGISKNEEAVKQFTDEVDRRTRLEAKEKGRALNNEEVQRIVDNLATTVTEVGSGGNPFSFDYWSGSKRLYQIERDKEIEISFDQIPPVELRKIREAMAKRKIPFSEKSALELYGNKLRQFRGR